MEEIIRIIQKIDSRVNLVFGYMAAGASLVCMFLIFSDVGGRYLFRSPISGTFEISEFLLTIMIFGTITHLELRKAHIRITVLYSRYPPKLQRAFDIFTKVIQTVLFGLFSIQTFRYFHSSWAIDEISWGSIPMPLWIPKFVIFVGCLLFFLHSAGNLSLTFLRWKEKK